MSHAFQIGRNKLMLLRNGTRFFPLLCADIDAAAAFRLSGNLYLCCDETGRLVSQALQRAALRGVGSALLLTVRLGGVSAGMGGRDAPCRCRLQWFRREISLLR